MSDDLENQVEEKTEAETEKETVEMISLAEAEEREKGLKQSQQKLLAEKKAAEDELKALRDAQKQTERKQMEEKEDFKGLFEQTKGEAETWKTKYDELLNSTIKEKIEGNSFKIAASIGVDESSQELLAEQARKFIKYADGKTVYEIGGVEVDKEAVIKTLSDKFPRLVKGSGASGAGAEGSKGNGVPLASKAKQDAIQAAKKSGDIKALRKAHDMKD